MLGRAFLAAVLCCVGCGKEWRPLDVRALRESRAQSIVLVLSESPSFVASTYGGWVLGGALPVGPALFAILTGVWPLYFFSPLTLLLPGVIADAVGNKIVRDNVVVDPGTEVGARLVEALVREHALEVAPTKFNRGAKLRDRPFGADLVLFVRTKRWGFSPASGGYKIEYVLRIELHDLRQQRILAAGECEGPPRSAVGRPGYAELVAGRAARLKRGLAYAGELCLRELATGVLAVTAAGDGDEDEDEDEDGEGEGR